MGSVCDCLPNTRPSRLLASYSQLYSHQTVQLKTNTLLYIVDSCPPRELRQGSHTQTPKIERDVWRMHYQHSALATMLLWLPTMNGNKEKNKPTHKKTRACRSHQCTCHDRTQAPPGAYNVHSPRVLRHVIESIEQKLFIWKKTLLKWEKHANLNLWDVLHTFLSLQCDANNTLPQENKQENTQKHKKPKNTRTSD